MKMRRPSPSIAPGIDPGVFPAHPEERVHEIRVAIKKLRAVLRLMRHEVSKDFYRREDLTLKRAAHGLAPYRDAVVIRKTLKRALRDCGGKAQKRLGPWVDSVGFPPNGASESANGAGGAGHETSALRAIQHFIDRGKAAGERLSADSRCLRRGLKWTYGKARKKYRCAIKTRDPLDFHDCRMWAKWLYLQIQAVEPRLPREMAVLIKRFEKLQEDLGKHHDTYLALKFLKRGATAPIAAKKGRRELADALRQRSKKIERRVRKAGELFAAGPEVFVRAMN